MTTFVMKPYRVEAWTFDEVVDAGRKSTGTNLVGGMPWSFTFESCSFTHENDKCYIVNGNKFTPSDMFVKYDFGCVVCPSNDFNTAWEPAHV